MLDKAKLGKRYNCYECGTKFYDLNRPVPLCPECGADQGNAPARDIRSLLSGGGRKIPKPEPEPEPPKAKSDDDEEDDDDIEDDEQLDDDGDE